MKCLLFLFLCMAVRYTSAQLPHPGGIPVDTFITQPTDTAGIDTLIYDPVLGVSIHKKTVPCLSLGVNTEGWITVVPASGGRGAMIIYTYLCNGVPVTDTIKNAGTGQHQIVLKQQKPGTGTITSPVITIRPASGGEPGTDTLYQPGVPVTAGLKTARPQQPLPSLLTDVITSPNPFAAQLTLSFTCHEAGAVNIGMYNASGRRERYINYQAQQGVNKVNISGEGLSSGLYFINISRQDTVVTMKVLRW
ncbi:T9SS type A sorting domain-containing protein [Chitinophaga sp. Mgbs1]|uniref:T9SS type A sorting domain-containing protein n=1 Tax=Chitinophaga solisilvae TaxID=1233460 RepID=A0A3S1CWU0_9BACT|nr:T9SS type A sorting domain-containing protein [Chitinophaga solisilvae]